MGLRGIYSYRAYRVYRASRVYRNRVSRFIGFRGCWDAGFLVELWRLHFVGASVCHLSDGTAPKNEHVKRSITLTAEPQNHSKIPRTAGSNAEKLAW